MVFVGISDMFVSPTSEDAAKPQLRSRFNLSVCDPTQGQRNREPSPPPTPPVFVRKVFIENKPIQKTSTTRRGDKKATSSRVKKPFDELSYALLACHV